MHDELIPQPAPILAQLASAEIDVQVATAKRYPRSLARFGQEAKTVATSDPDTAASCYYVIPRDGKQIEGPSSRLAEILATCWGNLRIDGRILDDSGPSLTAQAAVWDLERNVAARIEVRRRITGKNNRRYSDDMINVTANAAISIATRNAVLKIIPKAYWAPVYEQCRRVAAGEEKGLAARREQAIAYFSRNGLPPARVLEILEVQSSDEITLDHLGTLQGLATAIKEGQTTIAELLATDSEAEPKTLADLIK